MILKRIKNTQGFTLVELIIAMAVFSMAIVVLTISFIGLVRTQRIAAEDRSTQQNARKIIEEIVRDVRSASKIQRCNYAGSNTPALLVEKASPKLYFRSNTTNGPLMVAKAAAGSCTVASGVTPRQLTSRNVDVQDFKLIAVSDAPTATVESYGLDVELQLKSGASSTIFRTVASTRGEAPGDGSEEE